MPKSRRKIPLCPPVLIGDVGEYATLHFLRENGYETQKGIRLILDMQTASYSPHAKYAVLGSRIIFREELEKDKQLKKQFIKYYKSTVRRLEALLGKDKIAVVRNYLKDLGHEASAFSGFYTPDIVATKDGETYIIEVKANTGRIDTKEELEGLLRAKDYGFIPMLITLNVKIRAHCVIETLQNESENKRVREVPKDERVKQEWSFPTETVKRIEHHAAFHFLHKSGYELDTEGFGEVFYLVEQKKFYEEWREYGRGGYYESVAKKVDARTDKDKVNQYKKYIEELIDKKENEETPCYPDFVAEKDGHVYVVGIDSSLMRITKEKMEWLLRAKDYGFIPILVKPKVNIEVSNFAMETI